LKSRVVVWTIVGILVLVGIVFIVATKPLGSRGGARTLEQTKAYTDRVESQLNRLAMRLSQARKATPSGADTSKLFAEAERLLTAARAGIGKIRDAKEMKQAEAELRDVNQLIRQARRSLELASKNRAAVPSL
jgi:hypothetical protein